MQTVFESKCSSPNSAIHIFCRAKSYFLLYYKEKSEQFHVNTHNTDSLLKFHFYCINLKNTRLFIFSSDYRVTQQNGSSMLHFSLNCQYEWFYCFFSASTRSHQIYYMFGFLFVVCLILLLTVSETTILLCYFHLCAEVRKFMWLNSNQN